MARISKVRVAEIYLKKGCNVSATCTASNISRDTFYRYMKNDKKFKQKIEEAQEAILDNAETKLLSKINDGDTTALIFFLKTKAKDRGYTERKEVKLDEDAGIDIRFV